MAGGHPASASARLGARDSLLSRLCGRAWPESVLLDALGLFPALDVLDVGAGDGRPLRELARRGHASRVVGVDPTPGPGVQPAHAEALPFPDARFDVVLFARVLAHLPDPARALAEARRVLRPGGQVWAAAHGPAHLRATRAALRQPLAPGDTPPEPAVILTYPLRVTADDARFLLGTYGEEAEVSPHLFPVQDAAQLLVWRP
ncbi:2-methoxy-6-polyprenyl-1,4-benzoquinol methylase, mitochondrial [Deinococcus caeni]|uniref:2-methoxy-6-polyprenyl-1,4-benzoquinol methylase, mitochondrial n=1 Tax=Deinococcus caeni TaxID=569127 RepID=A0ABP9UBI8_9DEIO